MNWTNAAKLVTRDEARRIAVNIAKLPGLFEAAYCHSRFMRRSLIMRDYFEGEAHQMRRSSYGNEEKEQEELIEIEGNVSLI